MGFKLKKKYCVDPLYKDPGYHLQINKNNSVVRTKTFTEEKKKTGIQ